VITGTPRRYSAEETAAAMMESMAPGASIAEVARRRRICVSTRRSTPKAVLMFIRLTGEKVGYNFKTLAGTLGGERAVPQSHIGASLEILRR
jgi:hypothetical protein